MPLIETEFEILLLGSVFVTQGIFSLERERSDRSLTTRNPVAIRVTAHRRRRVRSFVRSFVRAFTHTRARRRIYTRVAYKAARSSRRAVRSRALN